MTNPFQYGGVVGNGAFCNRTKELDDLQKMMLSNARCFLYAERRMGKTSLIKRALDSLPKSCLGIYVDLWPTDGPASFATSTAKAIAEASESKAGRMVELVKSLFGRLRPNVSLDDSGLPKVEFGIDARSANKADLVEVLEAPQRLAEQIGKTVVVVFDEFQQILGYDSDLTERQLRSTIQHQQNVSYLFLGSRKHLLQEMFLDHARPLYRAASHYPLGPIATEHWQTFIATRFRKAKKKIDKDLIARLCTITSGHPFYTQHLCHVLWNLIEEGETASTEQLERATNELLVRESHAYTTLWESLTKNEQRLLRGLADCQELPKPFSADFTRLYGLRTASNSQRAAESLLRRDVIDREQGSFVITDRFFRLWIGRIV